MADMDLPGERREYQHGTLTREDLLDDPVAQFELWLVAAKEFGLRDPTAMNLATVDAEGMPYQRIVLLKGLSADGFVFFTNTESRKAQQIAGNAQVCLHFAWLAMDRQVIINGRAEALPKMDVVRYFTGRPRESQLAAWASRQSYPITARRLLEEKFHEMKRKFADGDVPLPGFWGGYRVRPTAIEFWQGGVHRLHDRFLYQRLGAGWEVTRLSP